MNRLKEIEREAKERRLWRGPIRRPKGEKGGGLTQMWDEAEAHIDELLAIAKKLLARPYNWEPEALARERDEARALADQLAKGYNGVAWKVAALDAYDKRGWK